MQNQNEASWYQKHNVAPPTHIPHGVTADNIREKLQPLRAKSWRLEGNRLIAKTDMGDVVNYISPNYIMTGTDETTNLPILKKIV